MKKYAESTFDIPKWCHWWRHQGEGNLLGCEIDGTLCCGQKCDVTRKDPTGFLRDRIVSERKREYEEKSKLHHDTSHIKRFDFETTEN